MHHATCITWTMRLALSILVVLSRSTGSDSKVELTLPPLPSLPPLPPTRETDVNTSSTTAACRYLSPFSCANGRCIRKQWRCDGHDDCGDNSDEQNCDCPPRSHIPCDNGKMCIFPNWLCDGAKNCQDRSDERDCGPLTTSPATPTACGGDINQPSGVIQSPGYPNRYPYSAHCVWIIHAPNSSQIILNVTDFAMEYQIECICDFLEIRKGSDETSPLLGIYCGYRLKPIIVSGSNTLRLEFKSNDRRSAQGFQIHFNTSVVDDDENSSTDCGGNRTDDNGEILSPRHPEGEQYPHNIDCTWLIKAPENHIIRLNFSSFDVEFNSGWCQYDYVLVENAEGSYSGKYCGTRLPPAMWSQNNTLAVTFHADGSVSKDGFKAKYKFYNLSCGVGNRTDNNGEISPPRHPGRELYPNNVDCTWLITAPEGHRIRLTFSKFDVQKPFRGSCHDYVMVKESDGSNIGRYCGKTLPPVIRSRNNTLTVIFHADGTISRAGFKARYEFFNEGESDCTLSTIPCDNGQGCISRTMLCDGDTDCADHSDERDCDKTTIPEDFFVTEPYEFESVPDVYATDVPLFSTTSGGARPFINGSLPGSAKEETGGAGKTAGTVLGILLGTIAVISVVGFCIYKQHLQRNTIIHFHNPVYKKNAEDSASYESGSPKEKVTLPM